jgi:hypothetical protein
VKSVNVDEILSIFYKQIDRKKKEQREERTERRENREKREEREDNREKRREEKNILHVEIIMISEKINDQDLLYVDDKIYCMLKLLWLMIRLMMLPLGDLLHVEIIMISDKIDDKIYCMLKLL